MLDRVGEASKHARYLDLVDPPWLVERRRLKAQMFASYRTPPEPDVQTTEPEWTWPTLDVPTFDVPAVHVDGYDYHDEADQPYFLELWIEKSTMNDIL